MPGARFTHAVSLRPLAERTDDEPEIPEAIVGRIVCHGLIDLLPDGALPELCDRIKDIFEFYTPHQRQIGTSLLTGTRIRARLGKAYERPEFHIVEE